MCWTGSLPLAEIWAALVRGAFWVLYNPLAWMYDWVSSVVSLGLWHDWQRASLPEIRGQRVLEVGFGTGEMLLELEKSGYGLAGLDLSRRMAGIAQQKLRRRGVGVPLVRGRGEQLPFADAAFDTVLSTFPAKFMVDADTLSEVARVLCPGGRAVVVAVAQFAPDMGRTWFLELLYRLTGQRQPVPDLAAQCAALGLTEQRVWKGVGRTSVLIILLVKDLVVDKPRSTDD